MNKAHDKYLETFRGGFSGILRWSHLEALWQKVLEDAKSDWYIYSVGETPPDSPADAGELKRFVKWLDERLHREHAEDYCGIVYADSRERPTFVKVYHPKNLGVVCGSSENPPLPGWTISKLKPVDLLEALSPPPVRKPWWRLIG
jgi:hypothetical protein